MEFFQCWVMEELVNTLSPLINQSDPLITRNAKIKGRYTFLCDNDMVSDMQTIKTEPTDLFLLDYSDTNDYPYGYDYQTTLESFMV